MRITMEKVDSALEHVEEVALVCALFICMCFLFINVVLRAGFNFILAFPDELARYLMIYIIYLGMSLGFRKQRQLKLDIMTTLMASKRRFFDIIGDGIAFIAAATIVYCGFQYTWLLYTTHEISSVMGVPLCLLYGIAPLTAVFMMFRLIRSIVKTVSTI